MKWFKDLTTITKLLIGFGVLTVLMCIVGYEGVSGMANMNDKAATLYLRDMAGLSAVKDLNITMAMVGRDARGTVAFTEQAAIERERQRAEALYQEFDKEMAICDKSFVTEEGKA